MMATFRIPCLVLALVPLMAFGQGRPVEAIRRGASVTVKVESFETAQKAAFDLASKYEGRVSDRQSEVNEKGRRHGWVRVLLPKTTLDGFLTEAKGLGKVYGENLTQEDGAPLIRELATRVVRLEEHKARLTSILDSSRKLRGSDVLYVQERIFRAAVDRDLLAQRQQAIADASRGSSVILTFFEPDPLQKGPRSPMGHLASAFQDAGKNLAKGLLGAINGIAAFVVYGALALLLFALFRRPVAKLGKWLRDFTQPSPPVR